MLQATLGNGGEITLPDALRERYGMTPQQQIRLVETGAGIRLVPLTDAPMRDELAQELAEWQSLGEASWVLFPYKEAAE